MIDGKTANEIFDSIRQHIIAGTLRAEDSLPPVRAGKRIKGEPQYRRSGV